MNIIKQRLSLCKKKLENLSVEDNVCIRCCEIITDGAKFVFSSIEIIENLIENKCHNKHTINAYLNSLENYINKL